MELPPGNAFAELAAALSMATVKPLAAHGLDLATITLPEGVSWPDMESRVLFVRPFYDALWSKVLRRCIGRNGVVNGAAILGSPGSE